MRYGVLQRTNQQQQSQFAKFAVAAGAALALTVGMVASTFAATNVVTPSDMMGWVDGSLAGGTVSYVDDAPAGFGSASLELKTDATTAAKAAYGRAVDMPLSDVATLSYYTKQVAVSTPEGSASLALGVDLDGDGTWDTSLVHEPYWRDALGDAAPVLPNEWQQWDVLSGVFWSSRSVQGLVGTPGGPATYTFGQILADYPNAKLVTLGVNIGTYNPSYTILVDGITLNDTVYDFERVAPEPEPVVPTSKDDCKQGGWMSLVNADGSSFKNQGQCVSYVQSNANSKHHR